MEQETQLLTPVEMEPFIASAQRMCAELDRLLLGRPALHRMVLVGILSQGHILLEGLPGVGKTALVKALGDLLQLDYRRIQCTPDLMPSDILGTHILQQTSEGKREMEFQAGPIFTNILLTDEINRASPKTQSAMLEAMQERTVTLMGQTRALPQPFFVLASQNPVELEGTYPLPEAQLDRFLFKLHVGHVDVPVLEELITTRRHGSPPQPEWRCEKQTLLELFSIIDRIFLPKPVARYIARLVAATRPDAEESIEAIQQYVMYGASPRAAIAMAEAGRAHALLEGRPTVGFEDIATVAPAILNHRIILNYKARFDKVQHHELLAELLKHLQQVHLQLSQDIEVREVVS
ncbi:MAG: AAA family ATPase [Myxococcota bacterium]